MLVWISQEQAGELERYSDLAGVSIGKLVEEAVGEYVECVVSSRSEALADGAAQA